MILSPDSSEVWITGAGVVSALGSGLDAHLEAIRENRCGLSRHQFFDGMPPDPLMCGMVADAVAGCTRTESIANWGSRLLAHALTQSLHSAMLTEKNADTDLIVGTTAGNIGGAGAWYRASKHGEKADPALLTDFLASTPLSSAAQACGITGKKTAITSACGTSLSAIGAAYRRIRNGHHHPIIAGGYDALSTYLLAGFNALRLISAEECRPFDRRRAGLNPGEAAATVVLESAESARSRGVRPLCRVAGFGEALESYHNTQPHPEGIGLAWAIERALTDAHITANQIDHLHLHGTATEASDLSEYRACEKIFGHRLGAIPACSTKSRTGHTFGAAGALNTIFSLLSLRSGLVPATLFYEEPDPQFSRLLLSPTVHGGLSLRAVMTTVLGFGGESFALILVPAEG